MASQGVQVIALEVAQQFSNLNTREKHYAHHMARAAWYGTRIILRQVSPESPVIFDFITELHRTCAGDWASLINSDVTDIDIERFLEYAATFLSNVGNYYGSGDQKFVPKVDRATLRKLAERSPRLTALYEQIAESISRQPPFNLGYPGDTSQSAYYLNDPISEAEIATVSTLLESKGIYPENTRIQKSSRDATFNVLVASVEEGVKDEVFMTEKGEQVMILRGDHTDELRQVCRELAEASQFAANDLQRSFLSKYIESFETGSLDTYRDSLRLWVQDKAPKVENIFGFVEPYRDPYGTRAEFEGLVAIADPEETKLLAKLVDASSTFIRRLPWATAENNGKGPFEKNLFEPPDISSIHSLAYCSSIIFPGINLPNYNDIRQEDGFKNVIIANRMAAEGLAVQYPFIDDAEAERFKSHKFPTYYWWVVLHELLGHGTGRMMVEKADGSFNFELNNPPLSALSGKPITCWYKPGQTWTGQFGDLATTVDECRAELVGAYLMDDKELLKLFGFTDSSEITADDVTYNLYQQLGVDGLRGLANFNVESNKWGQAHSRAHFAILKCLLRDGDGVVSINHEKQSKRLTVKVDRSKIATHGKSALGRMLLHLHMFRCTADVTACRAYYEDLSTVDGDYLEWRETVLANKPPPFVFVHANTFQDGDTVRVKEYEPTTKGVIQSWAERSV